jgi:hypothetical protein
MSHSRSTATAEDSIGIPAEQYLSVQLRLPQIESADGMAGSTQSGFPGRLAETQRALLQRLSEDPGIRGAAMGSSLPRMQHRSGRVGVEGEVNAEGFRGHRIRIGRRVRYWTTQQEEPGP